MPKKLQKKYAKNMQNKRQKNQQIYRNNATNMQEYAVICKKNAKKYAKKI